MAAIVVAPAFTAGQGLAAPDAKPGTVSVGDVVPLSPETKAKMQAFRPFSEAAGRIQEAVRRNDTGFAGVVPEEGQVVVWWKGELPAEVAGVINSEKVRIDVRQAKFSRQELENAAEPLAAEMKADRESPMHMIQIPSDGSRVIAVVDKDGVRISSSGVVPVETVKDKRIKVDAGPPTRYNDGWNGNNWGPFSGGGAIINTDNGGRCTAGFGVRNGAGQEFLLTAGHCGRPNGAWDNGNRSRRIGTATAEHVAHDLLLIPTDADNWMWDGGPREGFTKRVAGWRETAPNNNICVSGSTTGAVCNIRNSTNFVYSYCGRDIYGNNECYNDLVLAQHNAGVDPSSGGDSGGPVFELTPDFSAAIAVGTINGGWENDTRFLYQDFYTAARDFGITTIG